MNDGDAHLGLSASTTKGAAKAGILCSVTLAAAHVIYGIVDVQSRIDVQPGLH